MQTMRDPGIRKAAVFVAGLDRAAAESLLGQLPPKQASLIRQAASEVERIDAAERERIVDEFRRIESLVPSACAPGIELDALPALAANDGACAASPDASPDASPFDFLREAEEPRLLELLAGERPQTIALVLAHLPPEQAGPALAHFDARTQVEVLRRLADLDAADPTVLREVEQSLQSRFMRQFDAKQRRSQGPSAAARVLAACPSRVAGDILENLAAADAALAERLGHRPIAFDDLIALDDAALQTIFQAADPEVAQAALLGAAPQLVERVLQGMPPADAKILRIKLESPGPIRLSDLENARCAIAALARRIAPSLNGILAWAA